MPELPEVETIRGGLEKKIVGLTIKKVDICAPKSFIGKAQEVQGKKVIKVWRRAKMLGIDLTTGPAGGSSRPMSSLNAAGTRRDSLRPRHPSLALLFHLKMTGQLVLDDRKWKVEGGRMVGGHPTPDMRDAMPNSHTRVVFSFSDGSRLYFNDQRRFGWVKVVQSSELGVQGLFEKLGPEPLEKEFTWQILKQNLLKHKSTPIKSGLMDQQVVSGVGNIYANEACFNARIDPRARSLELSNAQFKKLHQGVVKALRDGIKHGGSTRAHFVDSEGHRGYFLDYAYVYGRDEHPCKICQTEIKKVTLGGRGTYFCPACQR
ncbi:bifunctional DNA-formamidopyrimidine glycosylase/DNA-(apurinic or apyrimidinic site) lyase [Candidatus Microgenomates bacterium]|nr:bifunctional DNA-formamidopyrimidine glycosylase/DNA-(apurinic or apyrimidinic site) lyase [Candidatus Microgenomates bacterium]